MQKKLFAKIRHKAQKKSKTNLGFFVIKLFHYALSKFTQAICLPPLDTKVATCLSYMLNVWHQVPHQCVG